VASLQPTGTTAAMADRDPEAGGDHLRVGDLHLPLLLVALEADLAASVGAALRQRGHQVPVRRASGTVWFP
jgi:hypothetical protein